MKMENDIDIEEDNNTNCFGGLKKCLSPSGNLILAACLTAVVVGIGVGMILKFYFPLSELDQLYVGFPGEMLLHMLQMMTVPLIVTSLVTGVSRLNAETSGRIIAFAAAYYTLTTVLSVTTGLILVLWIQPGGAYAVQNGEEEDEEPFFTVDPLLDLVRNMVPENLVQSFFQQYKTERMEIDIEAGLETNATEVQLVGRYVVGANIMGLIVWSFAFGLTLSRMGQKAKVLVDFLTALNRFTKCATGIILDYLPLGVLFMVLSHVLDVHVWEAAFQLGTFMLVVVAGLVIHGTVVLPLIYVLFVRRNPWAVIKAVSPALRSALLTSSSSATLPLALQCCEERLKLDKRITRFMLPIGTDFNMDGTALYHAAVVVFIAQLNHIPLDLSQLITLSVVSVVISVGTVGIPATGALTTLFILSVVSLPARDGAILVAVGWILNHCNTVVNVLGDCVGAALVHQVSKKVLQEMEEQELEMASMHDCDAEGHTADDIQVHVRSQDCDDDDDDEFSTPAVSGAKQRA